MLTRRLLNGAATCGKQIRASSAPLDTRRVYSRAAQGKALATVDVEAEPVYPTASTPDARPPAPSPHSAPTPEPTITPTYTASSTASSSTSAGGGSAAAPLTVADLDAGRFRLHPSVERWRDFSSTINTAFGEGGGGPGTPLDEVIRRSLSPALLAADPRAAAYWAYHMARLGFFIGQAATGVVAHHVSETLPAGVGEWLAAAASRGATAAGSSPSGSDATSAPAAPSGPTPFERLSARIGPEMSSRVGEALATWAADWEAIADGAYPAPWDMAPGHRQNSPGFMITRTAQFAAEAVATLRRRVRGAPEPLWLQGGGLYPDYYTKSFHFQTDGWLSDWSARVYEHSTEVLFFGRQDAMQRAALLPLREYVREREAGGAAQREMRLLEVAAGTGRFHTFIKDAFPQLPSVCSDLSPFYLARARDNLAYWARTRAREVLPPGALPLGGAGGSGTEFLQAAAEALPAADESFDVVLCVYLFHELPPAARAAAAAEFARVLRPGGLCVIADSVQRGDRRAWDGAIGNFSAFNEPYYGSYLDTDLGALFEGAGLAPDTKYMRSATKVLAFRKPGGGGVSDADSS